jgi:hypothetical protein
MLDNLNIVKFLIEVANCQTNFESNLFIYKPNLNLNYTCVMSDAVNTFLYINPDLTSEDDNLDVLYDMAKHKNSEAIVKAFEKDKFDFDFDTKNFIENEPHIIS